MVIDYFKNERKQTADFGRKTLEDQVISLGYKLDEDTLQKIEVAYDTPNREELFYRIGIGLLKLNNLAEVLKKTRQHRLSLLRKIIKRDEKVKTPETYVIGGDNPDGPRFVIATCCNPIPGDPVVGFKSPDGTVTVHKKSCPVAESIAAKHGDWVVVPKWLAPAEEKSFLVRISIKGIDRVGLLNEISRYLSLVMGVNMRRLNLTAEEGLFEGFIDLYVNSREILEKMLHKLSGIEGIESVTRSEL